jgi:pimeloyl-ACP methyl ester carboxylesterase
MVNWYLALLRKDLFTESLPQIKPRMLIICGAHDKFATHALARGAVRFACRVECSRFDDATHWAQHDEPDRVKTLLLELLR